MKAFYAAAVLVGTISVAFAQVGPEEHAAHHPEPTASEKAADVPAEPAMQARMKAMQDLMDRLGRTKDPAERARLLAQHRQGMHEQLVSMKHMGCGMSDASKASDGAPPGMSDKSAAGDRSGGMMGQGSMTGAGMMKCHQMMQARVDMMVEMMDQMLLHAEAQWPTRPGSPK